jgi:hypothetical protein
MLAPFLNKIKTTKYGAETYLNKMCKEIAKEMLK